MNPRLALLAALCGLNPALQAQPADQPVGGEPRIVAGSFADPDATAQPLALWLEQGSGLITAATLPAGMAPALRLPAQQPAARACLLLSAPETSLASLRLRLKLASAAAETANPAPASETATPAAPETLEWELAGVPLRFTGGEEGRWQVDFHTAESGWRPLLAPEGEDLAAGTGDGWHTLTLEFPLPTTTTTSSATPASSAAAPRSWRLRWDEREPSPWIAADRTEPALLVINAGPHTAVWLDDLATVSTATTADPSAAAALAARNAALREEIASALRDLSHATGIRRQLLRRRAAAAPRPAASHAAHTGGLTILTPLEERQSETPAE